MFKNWSYNPTSRTYCGIFDTADHLPSGYYTISQNHMGDPVAKVLDRSTDNILFFNSGPMQNAINEINDFYAKGDRYRRLGVAHKRGILLHGPAGCGKTKIVAHAIDQAIAKKGIAISVTRISDFTDGLPLLRQIEPNRPVLAVMEDLERMCDYNEEEILEAMDGASSLGDNILFLATTNKLL